MILAHIFRNDLIYELILYMNNVKMSSEHWCSRVFGLCFEIGVCVG